MAPCLCRDGELVDDPLTEPDRIVNTSEFTIRFKEIFILSLFFLLMIYSFVTFYMSWSKNYKEINYVPNISTTDQETQPDIIDMGMGKFNYCRNC